MQLPPVRDVMAGEDKVQEHDMFFCTPGITSVMVDLVSPVFVVFFVYMPTICCHIPQSSLFKALSNYVNA